MTKSPIHLSSNCGGFGKLEYFCNDNSGISRRLWVPICVIMGKHAISFRAARQQAFLNSMLTVFRNVLSSLSSCALIPSSPCSVAKSLKALWNRQLNWSWARNSKKQYYYTLAANTGFHMDFLTPRHLTRFHAVQQLLWTC